LYSRRELELLSAF